MPKAGGNQLCGKGYSLMANTLLIPFFVTQTSCDLVINRPLPANLSLISQPNLDGLFVSMLRKYRYKSRENDIAI